MNKIELTEETVAATMVANYYHLDNDGEVALAAAEDLAASATTLVLLLGPVQAIQVFEHAMDISKAITGVVKG